MICSSVYYISIFDVVVGIWFVSAAVYRTFGGFFSVLKVSIAPDYVASTSFSLADRIAYNAVCGVFPVYCESCFTTECFAACFTCCNLAVTHFLGFVIVCFVI